MNTLIATREKESTYNCVTTLKNKEGKVKAIVTGYHQPKKTHKFVIVNGLKYVLEWESSRVDTPKTL